jgi:steroid delta-isomerase-like uncharacterized protein
MAGPDDQSLRESREVIVLEHIAAENRHDVEGTIATFQRPRYEVNGEPSDGEAAVRELLQGLMDGFSDAHWEVRNLHHADKAVIGEARMTGTHDGSFAAIPATGRRIDVPMALIFEFEEDRLMCEKVYMDLATILRQIGVLPEAAAA